MIPAARQRVCVEGRTGLYFVLSVNQEYGCADLLDLNSMTLVEAVRFERIVPAHPEIEEDEPIRIPKSGKPQSSLDLSQ
jgi:hypothetical protein